VNALENRLAVPQMLNKTPVTRAPVPACSGHGGKRVFTHTERHPVLRAALPTMAKPGRSSDVHQ
jgi:hypothetical protein